MVGENRIARFLQLLEVMDAVDSLDDLVLGGLPRSIRLHPLRGVRKGEWAIDIHKTSGWRIWFVSKRKNSRASKLKITTRRSGCE